MNDQPNVIELQIDRISELFNTLDPYPFRQRDIDHKAEEFVTGWARELDRTKPISIVIHAPQTELGTATAQAVEPAFAHYYATRAEAVRLELRELFRVGRASLAIGLVVLALCIGAGQILAGQIGDGYMGRFADESLIIVGWVANWRPIEIFLYEWWPLLRRRNLFRRLSAARVELRATAG